MEEQILCGMEIQFTQRREIKCEPLLVLIIIMVALKATDDMPLNQGIASPHRCENSHHNLIIWMSSSSIRKLADLPNLSFCMCHSDKNQTSSRSWTDTMSMWMSENPSLPRRSANCWWYWRHIMATSHVTADTVRERKSHTMLIEMRRWRKTLLIEPLDRCFNQPPCLGFNV